MQVLNGIKSVLFYGCCCPVAFSSSAGESILGDCSPRLAIPSFDRYGALTRPLLAINELLLICLSVSTLFVVEVACQRLMKQRFF